MFLESRIYIDNITTGNDIPARPQLRSGLGGQRRFLHGPPKINTRVREASGSKLITPIHPV